MINDFDLSDIEANVSASLRTLGFPRVWNNRPKATDDGINDFVVVSVSGELSDRAAYGSGRIFVSLFARDIKELKNSKKLSVMQKRLLALPLAIERVIIDGRPRIVGDTADDFGFHARVIVFNAIIKV